MNVNGVVLGLIVFGIIGLFHPLVIKAEYYFGKRSWVVFLFAGLIFIVLSLFVKSFIPSATFGVLGFTCLWSIKEVIEQEERVKQGRFPKNPKRKY